MKSVLNAKTRFLVDASLYSLIAGFSATQTYIAQEMLPKAWAPGIGISLAVLVALKAKLSRSSPDEPAQKGSVPD